jgi:hypothetical protein
MKTMNKVALALLVAMVVMLCPTFAQQNYLIQTTLTAAQPAPAAPGSPPVPSTFASVASVTGLSGIQLNQTATINQQTSWQIYVDRELETIVAVNGLVLQVQRGQGGTLASAHASGAMVLAGRAFWFYVTDPGAQSSQGITFPSNTPCVLANVVASPWVNIRTGAQWICNPTSLTWTAGFNNPFLPTGTYFNSSASTATQPIAGPVIKLTGTTAATSFTFTGNGAIGINGAATANSNVGGEFCVIPTGAWPTTAGNNIGATTTGVAGVEECWLWNGTDGKWYEINP